MGILALLDEESRFPRATVFSLVGELIAVISEIYLRHEWIVFFILETE